MHEPISSVVLAKLVAQQGWHSFHPQSNHACLTNSPVSSLWLTSRLSIKILFTNHSDTLMCVSIQEQENGQLSVAHLLKGNPQKNLLRTSAPHQSVTHSSVYVVVHNCRPSLKHLCIFPWQQPLSNKLWRYKGSDIDVSLKFHVLSLLGTFLQDSWPESKARESENVCHWKW